MQTKNFSFFFFFLTSKVNTKSNTKCSIPGSEKLLANFKGSAVNSEYS